MAATPLLLEAHRREALGRHARALRRSGEIPAVVYGHNQPPVAIAADAKTLERIWQRAGRTHLVDLTVGGGRARKVLIREVQVNPRTGRPVHVDFFAVNLREKITADVPLIPVGEAPAVVDTKVGVLQQVITSVRIECLPGDIPAQLTVDVSGLTEIDQQVNLGEVVLPAGVALVHADLGETVVKIAPMRVRAEEEEAPAAEAAEPAAEGAAAEGAAGAEDGEG